MRVNAKVFIAVNGFETRLSLQDPLRIPCALGKHGLALIRTLHEMAAAAVRSGQRVIMDHVTTLHPPLLQDCVTRLAGLPVLFVALRPPEALLLVRIQQRMAQGNLALDPNSPGAPMADLSR